VVLSETWKEQYDRMQRSFALLQQIGENNAQLPALITATDVLYHFCADAYHLRDWIAATIGTDKASTEAAAKRIDTEAIEPSLELRACCDIANGFKHLVLHRKSYVTKTKQGHAKVVCHEISIYTTIRIEDYASGTATVLHPDGTLETDVPLELLPEPGSPEFHDGWVTDTFKIDINEQEYDARDVAVKAVAAWDLWLNGSSTLAAQLR
jgi:hypothetical protein